MRATAQVARISRQYTVHAERFAPNFASLHPGYVRRLRPLQALDDRAPHHPVLVALAEKAQLLGEMADALAVARLGVGVREIGAPIAALRAIGVEHALDMDGDVAERVGLARNAGRGRQRGADVGIVCLR